MSIPTLTDRFYNIQFYRLLIEQRGLVESTSEGWNSAPIQFVLCALIITHHLSGLALSHLWTLTVLPCSLYVKKLVWQFQAASHQKKGTFCWFSKRHNPLTKPFTCRAWSLRHEMWERICEWFLLIHAAKQDELAAALVMNHYRQFSEHLQICYTISLLRAVLSSRRQLANWRN